MVDKVYTDGPEKRDVSGDLGGEKEVSFRILFSRDLLALNISERIDTYVNTETAENLLRQGKMSTGTYFDSSHL